MKNVIRNALIAKMAGIAEWKNEKEQWWEDQFKDPITIEWLGDEKVVVKRYWKNGQLEWEENYKDGELNGVCKNWYDDGQLGWEANYKDNKLNGMSRDWYKNGQLGWEANYKDDELINEKRYS